MTMTATCEECGAAFDTDQDLRAHQDEEHGTGSRDIGEMVVDAWGNPRAALLIGIFIGVLVTGSLLLSPPGAFDDEDSSVGQRVLQHFQEHAPAGVSYTLVDTTKTTYGMKEVTLKVVSGTDSHRKKVYVSMDGTRIFTQPPETVDPMSTLDR